VIVGGGLAGLTAAWHLRDLDIVLLERSERLGGRIRSEPRDDVWVNLGAHVFSGRGTAMDRLLQDTGTAAVGVPGRLAAVALNGRVTSSGAVETYPLRMRLPLRSRAALVRAGTKLRLAVRRYAALASARPGEDPAERQRRLLDFLDDRTFAQFLGPVPEDVDSVFRATLNRSSGEPEELAAGYGVGYFHLVWDRSGGLSRGIPGGPSRLIDSLARGVGDRIRRSTEATSIEPSAEHVTVRYTDAEGDHALVAEAVVMAGQAPDAARLVHGLPRATRDALESIRYGPYAVGAIVVDGSTPMPWRGLYALATPQASFNMLFNTTNIVEGSPEHRSGLETLMVYAGASRGRALLAHGDGDIGGRFADSLVQLYPEAAGRIKEVVVCRWERGLPYPHAGRAGLQAALLAPLGRVHLAGDYLGSWYTETAVQTAERAARGARACVTAERRSART
jgi:protoporphyrinogen/coproporphyrinogen III oxidase